MKLVHLTLFPALMLGAACAQIKIPEVENVVELVMSKLGGYVQLQGNHSSDIKSRRTFDIAERQSTSYWYETISHQGISAFGPSGYQTYRNVKDYGATGRSSSIC